MVQFYSPKKRPVKKQATTLEVTASALDANGQGIAHAEGKTIFVKGLLPQETARIRLTEEKRQFAKGEVIKRLTTSEQRIAPHCEYYERCGGCQQQHVPIALQRTTKAGVLSHLIKRETGVIISAEPVIAGAEYGYRRRARLGLRYQPEKGLVMGFRQERSNDLVMIKKCPVLKPQLNDLLSPLWTCLKNLTSVCDLGHVEMVLADNGPLVILRHLSPLPESDKQSLRDFSQTHQVTMYLAGNNSEIARLTSIEKEPFYQIEGLNLRFAPTDFIQVNDEINPKMVAQAIEWLDLSPEDRVLDLFCGMGNFTLPIAKRVSEVVGIEGVPALVDMAKKNAELNQLGNAHFWHADLSADFSAMPWSKEGFNKVLLDPARAGALEVMSHIVKLSAEKIVYVSCNPTTLARDSKILLDSGYQLIGLKMLDMFPQTGHLESMALFSRK
ncbi:23S rRNA (uracil(1939)-C(5))-methyltransferase RlmD [Proteus sp. WDL240414]|uniref:23S rRNA (uracil(1939)-C(5))-methyltransferase RlmD n=2 Tax=Proteus TaxID=583 RepID=A0A6I7D6W5_9GAMM|nr:MULTISPECIES: 23S rRNA (uracil(1939)-C(5))-methyltransferase RlmD [Proteus]MBG2801510.1 23S rRNA (uracil(1939)-C(5))-methyltransferase RlmD [Proteus mirabilis]MBG3150928.1 23S rRNA (uracil(1939)-C(5))-methyltransferase RlmD [Proteus mirabilis]QHN09682.1 23S rRNA (uracil(1939)-C(5))-methyltransferase RlmD [Proteus columbae]